MVYYSLRVYNKTMLMVGMFKWWYSEGLRSQVFVLQQWMVRTIDFFSLTLLLKTLFNPFRQISASMLPPSVPLEVKLKSAGDRLFSRFFGFAIRSIMIIIGALVIALQFMFSVFTMFAWVLIPFSLVFGVAVTVMALV